MKLFDTLMSKIFGNSKVEAKIESVPTVESQTATTVNTQTVQMTAVDVDKVLSGMAGKNKEKLNWKTSIVDLMKLVEMDSSLSSRKELASEMSFDGDMNDSATMNVWLHKQVMMKIAENGGILPEEMRS